MSDEQQMDSGSADAGESSGGGEPSKDERTMGMLCHLSALVTGFIGPLIIWLIKKEESAFVDDQGKESLNFQITFAIAGVAIFITGFIPVVNLVTGCVAFPIIMIAWLVLVIMATIEANKGVKYRYPVCLRLIK